MKIRSVSVLAVLVVLGVANACSSDDAATTPKAGSERGACYGNGTCDTGLVCRSQLCVSEAGSTNGGGDTGGTPGGGTGNVQPTAGKAGSNAAGRAGDGGTTSETNAGAGGQGGAGVVDEGGAAGAGPSGPPTKATLHLSWTLKGADSNSTIACANAGGNVIEVVSTKVGQVNGDDDLFACSLNAGDVSKPFGDYKVSVALVSDGNAALGSAPVLDVTFAASPCDQVLGDTCVIERQVVVVLDGK